MRAKVRMIFVILIAAAVSGTYMASADDSPPDSPYFGKCLNTATSLTSAETKAGPAAVHRRHDSPEDTIWFDDFLVVGSDTLSWEQAYGWVFAWQEYNVTPEDTIWFDDFLVVGSDTLYYTRDYAWSSTDRKLIINIPEPTADWYSPELSLRFYNSGMHYDPFYVGFLWQNRNGTIYSFGNHFFIPDITPIADWIEIAVNHRKETERPLYSYYMPLPPQGPYTSEGLVQRRRAGSENDKSLISILRSLLLPESDQ